MLQSSAVTTVLLPTDRPVPVLSSAIRQLTPAPDPATDRARGVIFAKPTTLEKKVEVCSRKITSTNVLAPQLRALA